MSKLTKLVKSPGLFFEDAVRNRLSLAKSASKKSTPKKQAAKGASTLTVAEKRNFKVLGQVEFLKELVLAGDYEPVKRAWNLVSESGRGNAEILKFMNLRVEVELAEARHDEVMKTGHVMVAEYNAPLGNFYRAKSLFVRGKYVEAQQELQCFLYKSPNHADGIYLLCEIFERLGDCESAWQALEALALVSKRVKTWHVMANLVQNNADVFRLMRNWKKWKADIGPAYHKDVSEFIALGALRAGNFQLARSIWRESMVSASKKKGGFASMKNRKPSYSSKRAEAALSDLNRVFREAEIEMFLVSGTLLGCVREEKLLGHDKDIDIGIWSTVSEEQVLQIANESGLFVMLKSRSKEIIRLRHVNGIAIDVFYHFQEDDDYWHGGVKMIWHNSPFKLIKHKFLGEEYLIPKSYDRYLTENYGDWRTPKIDFDSAFDTPNGEIKCVDEMAIHSYKGLLACCIDENWEKAVFYLDQLSEVGEDNFVEKYTEILSADPEFVEAKQTAEGNKSQEFVPDDMNVENVTVLRSR